MFTEIQPLAAALSMLKDRIAALREAKEAGYTAEAVVVIGLMVIGAIAIVAIVVGKITGAANNISM